MRTSLVIAGLAFVVAACGPSPADATIRRAELDELEAERRSLQAQLAEQRREIERLQADLARKDEHAESVPPAPPADPPKTIHGVVQACNNNVEIVIVSVGSRDSVGVGSEFSVERDGKLVATIVIDKVFPNYASGTFKPGTPKTPIQAGDECVGRAPRTSVCLPK